MDIKGIIFGIGGIVVFYGLWILYVRIAYRKQKPDQLGRLATKPGVMSWLVAFFSACMCLFFGFWTIAAIVLRGDDLLFWILIGPPLIALMGFSTYIIAWTRLRVSLETVEYKGLRGWEKFGWNDVICVDNHSGLGTRLKIRGLRPKYFWAYGYGAQEIKSVFDLKDKPFVP